MNNRDLEEGRIVRPDILSLIFYKDGEPIYIKGGSFVSKMVIKEFNIPEKIFINVETLKDKYFIHPDSLRVRGAFDFAYKKKGKFTVGVIRDYFGKGDLLIASVIAKALKYKYKDKVKVWFAVKPGYQEILQHSPFVDKVFTSRVELLEAYPDVHVEVNDLDFRAEVKEFEKTNKILSNRTSIYLEGLGLELENKMPCYIVTLEENKWAIQELRKKGLRKENKKIIGIQLCGSNISRTYPAMDGLIKVLKAKDYEIIILDRKIRNKYEYSISQMAAIINQCNLIISSNSAAYHFAGAMKKRAIALFGSCDGEVWTQDYEKVSPVQIPCPLGQQKCWWKLACIPGKNIREKEQKGTPACLANIPTKMIVEEVENHFAAKKILVVVLTYNLLHMTKAMLDSVRSFHDYNIIVIDNASTDRTVDYLEENGIRYISKPLSVAQAWNLGLKIGYDEGYDYVLVCNNDIILSDNYIDTVVEVADRRRAYFVTGKVMHREGLSQTVNIPPNPDMKMLAEIERPLNVMEAGDYSAFLLSRECIRKVGGFDERFKPRYQSDEEHMLRLRFSGNPPIQTFATTFFHVLGGVVHNIPKETKKMNEEWERNIILFKKLYNVHLYNERHAILANINLMKKRNPDWEGKIYIPLDGVKK